MGEANMPVPPPQRTGTRNDSGFMPILGAVRRKIAVFTGLCTKPATHHQF